MHIYNWILDVAPSLWFAAALEHRKQNSCHLHCGLFQHLLIQWCYSPHACCIMASNNSENTHLRGDLGTKQSLAALLLWNSFPFGALICQVFLRSTEQGSLWSASLHVTYRPLSSLAFVLSWMHWSCLMCTLRSGPLRSLFPACRRSPPSVCTHTHTGTQTAHIHSLKPLYLNLRCQVLWKMITQSSCHSATEPCCIWLLQNFYSGHEILTLQYICAVCTELFLPTSDCRGAYVTNVKEHFNPNAL